VAAVRLNGQSSDTSDLSELLEAAAATFSLGSVDDAAPAGVIELESLRDRKPHGVGIYVKQLSTAREAMVRPDVSFETQSVIKVAIMIRAYQLADAGKLDLSKRVSVGRSAMSFGSGVLRHHQEGLRPTLRDLVTEMIITSDNTATDLVLAEIGGVSALNAWLASTGFTEARMGMTAYESWRLPYELADPRHRSLTVSQVFALRSGDAAWAGMTDDWLRGIQRQVNELQSRSLKDVRTLAAQRGVTLYFGRMTPREAGRLLEGIERSTWASPASSAEMKRTLLSQKLGVQRLPHYVDVEVGHKTGDSYPWDANDVGIMYAPSGPIVVAVFANDLGGTYGEEEDRIGRIGRTVLEYFRPGK
jgi:beta-lactamase class A